MLMYLRRKQGGGNGEYNVWYVMDVLFSFTPTLLQIQNAKLPVVDSNYVHLSTVLKYNCEILYLSISFFLPPL